MRDGAPRRHRRRRQPRLPRRQRLLPPDPAAVDLGRAQPPPGLLQGRHRGPDGQREPALTTVNWNQAPVNNPESTLIGSMYQSVGAKADLVVTDASSWFWNGCNLTDGHTFPDVDPRRVRPLRPVPARPAQRRRPGALARPRPVQLVRHHLLHGARERRRRVRQRIGLVRLAALDHGHHLPRRRSRRHSRRHRRDPPGDGERLRPLRARSGQHATAAPAGNWTEVYTGSRPAARRSAARDRLRLTFCGADTGASRVPRATTAVGRRRRTGMTPLFGPGTPYARRPPIGAIRHRTSRRLRRGQRRLERPGPRRGSRGCSASAPARTAAAHDAARHEAQADHHDLDGAAPVLPA